MTHPYAALIAAEAKRAEDDLTAFRSRAITVVTTSSGVVTLLTGAVTFAASKSDDDAGVPGFAVICFAVALFAFVAAAILALQSNAPIDIKQPDLGGLTEKARWDDGETELEHERVASRVVVAYVDSVQAGIAEIAKKLRKAISLQVVGLAISALAATVTLASL